MLRVFEFLELSAPIQVMDVGASVINEVPLYQPLLAAGLGHLNAFEGDVRQIEGIKATYGDSATVYRDFLFDGSEQTLYLADPLSGMTSLFRPDPASLAFFNGFENFGHIEGSEQVQTRRLDDIDGLPRLDLVKMDIQGAELTVLKHGTQKLRNCLAIQLEVSYVCLYEGQPSFGEVDIWMRSQGYVPHCFLEVKQWSIAPTIFEGDFRIPGNQLLESDVVYVKNPMRLTALDTDQIAKFAAIAHYCLGSADLCVAMLIELERREVIEPDSHQRYAGSLQGNVAVRSSPGGGSAAVSPQPVPPQPVPPQPVDAGRVSPEPIAPLPRDYLDRGGDATSMQKFHVCLPQPEGYQHSLCLLELSELLMYSLQDLGHDTTFSLNSVDYERRNIIVGCHLLLPSQTSVVPPSTIVVNSEQIYNEDEDHFDWKPNLFAWLRSFEAWDYSPRNIAALEKLGFHGIKLLKIGHQPQMNRIPKAPVQDIDVLFYGSVTDRRKLILEQIMARGMKLKNLLGTYGAERDEYISRAKVVLNLHNHPSEIFEVVRVHYLLSNGVPVVGEVNPSTTIPDYYADAISGVPYDRLVNECERLVNDVAAREALGQHGLAVIAQHPQAAFTSELLK